jgi:PAS domain S-box-containing protein
MLSALAVNKEVIVTTLLEVGDRVLEISADHVITAVWYGAQSSVPGSLDKYIGEKVADTPRETIISEFDSRIAACFATRKNIYFEYDLKTKTTTITYSVRILPIHPDREYLFVVIENLSKKEGFEIVEDTWKLALDAAGDGVWDYNPATGKMFFSDKWHELFGYGRDEITDSTGWGAKIHPDDLARSHREMQLHAEGVTPSYSIELRYRCKDGSYKWMLSRGLVINRDESGAAMRIIGTHTDINERKIAEAEYLATAHLLSKLIDNLHSGILVTDEHNKVLFANQMFCDLYEVGGGPGALIGTNMERNVDKRKLLYKDEEEFGQRTRDIFEKKELVLNEEWEMKDGRTISRDYIPMFLNETTFRGILQLKDISDQKKNEQQLKQQRIFYEDLLNQIPADIAVFNADHTYLFANKNSFKNDEELRQWIIGRKDEDYARLKNKPATFVTERYKLLDNAIASRRPVEWIEKLTNRQGETEHHLRILKPVFDADGSHKLTLAYGLNVTDLIVTQEALKTSVETFSSAFEHSGVGMALISPFGHWLDMNSVVNRLMGYTKEELQKITFQDITYHEDLEKDVTLVKQMLKKEITTYTLEKRYVSKEKRIIWASLTVSMVWNSDDTPKFFIAQILDITKRKELEKEVNQRNSEMEATKASLINKVKQLEELSYVIAHNLRGAAGNIKAISGAMVAKNKGGQFAAENPLSDAFTTEEAMAFIEESSISLMNSLSTLMKITEIKLNNGIPYNVCNVENIVNDIVVQLNGVIYEKQAIVKLDIQLSQVNYPKAYLENILYNLISNALKYSRPGVTPEVTIYTQLWDGRPQIIVEDNGLGIDMQKYGHLVFKLNNVFHKGFDSKGVGLYITKTQVESLGGNITVASEVDHGSKFTVTL